MDRRAFWRGLDVLSQSKALDLVIVGGGINGAGVARDAALNGLKTLLVEKGDYGGGTTASSSRLIHGGLRYLDQLEFGLVKESLHERATLLRAAPHLVRPLEITIPIYRSNRHRFWKVKLGMWLYDWLSRKGELPRHRSWKLDAFAAEHDSISREGLEGAVSYFDGQVVFPERLCLETVLAARSAGAHLINYAELSELGVEGREDGAIRSLTVSDSRLGEKLTVEIGTHTVVLNAAGPWVDRVLSRTRSSEEMRLRPQIGGVKGSHILVNPFPGAPSTALYVEASDGRPYFVIPWLGRFLIGTTECRFDDDPDEAKADDDEIDYLLTETNRVIPSAILKRSHVLLSYAGVRALPAIRAGSLGQVTRRHQLVNHSSEGVRNLWSLVGGKLTTYRAVAAEITDSLLALHGRKRVTRTDTLTLPGAFGDAAEREQLTARCVEKVGAECTSHWLQVYGARSNALLRLVDEEPDLAGRLSPGNPDLLAQVRFAFEEEDAETLCDFVCRRIALPMRAPELFRGPSESLETLAENSGRALGWDEARVDRELSGLRHTLETRFLLPS